MEAMMIGKTGLTLRQTLSGGTRFDWNRFEVRHPSMGQSGVNVNDAEKEAIQARIGAAVSAIDRSIGDIAEDYEEAVVADDTVSIPLLQALTPAEALSAISFSGGLLSGLTRGLIQASSGYMTASQLRQAEDLEMAAQELMNLAGASGAEPIPMDKEADVEEYYDFRSDTARSLTKDVERVIATAEGSKIPISEKPGPAFTSNEMLAVGALGGLGLLAWALFS